MLHKFCSMKLIQVRFSLPVPLLWTAHHLKKSRRLSDQKRTVNCMLPVIYHVSHDKLMQHHLITMDLDNAQYLNPGQSAVTNHFRKKQLFWECHDRFSKFDTRKGMMYQTYFSKFGPMFLELNILSCHGQFVKGTGMEEALTSTGQKTVGLTTALCDANSLKKTRHTVQLPLFSENS